MESSIELDRWGVAKMTPEFEATILANIGIFHEKSDRDHYQYLADRLGTSRKQAKELYYRFLWLNDTPASRNYKTDFYARVYVTRELSKLTGKTLKEILDASYDFADERLKKKKSGVIA